MIPQAAITLILEAEGIDQPSQWPGGASGISLGVGYDLSAETAAELVRDWTPFLGVPAVDRLLAAVGQSGSAAEALAPRFRDIHITATAAQAVFDTATLPKYEAQTDQAFPGVRLLPDLARGALVSLIFNRGTAMDGPRRAEMRTIRDAIATFAALPEDELAFELPDVLRKIAAAIRSMKRLWLGQGLPGLLARRDNEAALIESAIPPETPAPIVA